jgi:hypothetical protein
MHIRNRVSPSRNFGRSGAAPTAATSRLAPATTPQPLPLFGSPLPQGSRNPGATHPFQPPVKPLEGAAAMGHPTDAIHASSHHSPIAPEPSDASAHCQPAHPSLPESEIQSVLTLLQQGMSSSKIMKTLWNTPPGGHRHQHDAARLTTIQSIIAQRYLATLAHSQSPTPLGGSPNPNPAGDGEEEVNYA